METVQPKPVHQNPVYGSYFADPYIWKSGGIYYAIGTGELEARGEVRGKIFPVLQSEDFLHWTLGDSALVRPEESLGAHFWAPEVVPHGDRFFLYYSVGHGDKNHQLRVAISDSPLGPYHDTGKSLLDPERCPFAIDAHPFQDDDGQWYLFYARDFLDVTPQARAGTALMVARMKSMTELEDEGRVVMRAQHDWQRFQANRSMYGKVWDWHTLEGPFVRKHEGRYYCFYSGGRWENDTYGVDYCVAESVLGPYLDEGNEAGPRVLRTVPGQVIGPGHNSIVTEPDGETDYLVYHAWDREMKARQMFIDRLVWTPEGPRCEGPTWGSAFNART
ncbi:MAG: family 43 glycosylhydrolase [Akkermansiaceae bacterium]|nr:family 43 glycosylhydrolase [Verrucomicrobiales bacterium]